MLAIDTAAPGVAATSAADVAKASLVQQQYAQLPLSFEANQGQTDSQVDFLARGAGYSMFLTGNGAVIDLHQAAASPSFAGDRALPANGAIAGTAISMQFVGANANARVVGVGKQQSVSHYLIGNDPSEWHAGVANFGQVEYQNLYSGVNAVFHGNQRQVEYDYQVAPGADPKQIQLQIAGASGLSIDSSGNLLIHTPQGDLVEKAPTVYQDTTSGRAPVAGHFVLQGTDRVGFSLGGYDASIPLVIDPTLDYSTFVGGANSDLGASIAVDSAGNAYVTGTTGSPNFPVTPGAYQSTYAGYGDVFIAKLSPDGSSLVYSTFLGGSTGGNNGDGIAIDGSGCAYVAGLTSANNFPTTSGAFQTAFQGGGTFYATDAFVAKLSPDGSSLVYSTYLGGSGDDVAYGIAVDGSGDAYVAGQTSSADLPTTAGAYRTAFGGGYQDAFVTKLNASGSGLVYSTFLGGSNVDYARGIALDGAGEAFITGTTQSTDFPATAGAYQTTSGGGYSDAFVSKLSAGGGSLVYSTYLGGSGDGGPWGNGGDFSEGIAVDGAGAAYVTGYTGSPDFPVTPSAYQTASHGLQDAFVAKLNADGGSLAYSTYLGGSGVDVANGIAVDHSGNAFLTGETGSADFPTTPDALQTTFGGLYYDAFVAELGADGGLAYSTYLGGTGAPGDVGNGIAVDSSGNVYVTGSAGSANFPTTPGAYQTVYGGGDPYFGSDVFIAKLLNVEQPAATATTVSSSANPSVYGQPVVFTAEVANTSGAGATPAGSVQFVVDGQNYGDPVALDASGRAASAPIAFLAGDSHSVVAVFTPANDKFLESSGSLAQSVQSEGLEPDLLSPGAVDLFVGGTAQSSHIDISLSGGQVIVDLHDGSPPFQTPLAAPIQLAGMAPVAGLNALVIYGQANNEHIQVDKRLTLPAFIFGGNGANVHIQAGGGPTVEVGGSGANNHLEGGPLGDLLIAGQGGGHLEGNGGDDILIGGYTDFDSDLLALESIMAEWGRAGVGFSDRVGHLLGPGAGGSTGGFNGNYYLNANTVHDDGVKDHLEGGAGADWYFARLAGPQADKTAPMTTLEKTSEVGIDY